MENLIPIYIAVFIPIFLMLIQQNEARMHMIIRKRRKKRGVKALDIILEKCVGRRCVISTGSMGISAVGIVKQVTDKWVEIETRNTTEILGLDFIQHVKIKKDR